ncbi:MAG: hypothetical protein JKY37_14595, partial [Nannocystaceae bacterium]|nr:hypothetical protein [Nannocystaceae bacterium]
MRGSDSSGSGFRLRRASQVSSVSLQRLGAGGHLLKDIDRYHRRRVARRLVQVAAVVSVVLLAAWVALTLGERRTRSETVVAAQGHMAMGTSTALDVAVEQLKAGLVKLPDDPQLTGLLALVRGHAWLEFDAAPQETRTALMAISDDDPVQPVAAAMLAFADSAFAEGIAALDRLPAVDEMSPMLRREAVWLRGHLEVTVAGGGLASARAAVDTWVTQHPDDIAMRRLQAHMQLHAGAAEEALATLAALRNDAPGHMGLAADDALYHAVLRTKLAGVASVADQLFESDAPGLSRADRAHAVLARAVVHAH